MNGEQQIGGGTAFMMVILALVFDGVSALLDLVLIGFILDPFIDLCAALVFGIWFAHHGLSFMSSRRVGGFLLTILGKFIPGIEIAPLWTVLVIYTILQARGKSAVAAQTANTTPHWRL